MRNNIHRGNMPLIQWGGVAMLCELLLSLSLLSCQRELELQPIPGQDVPTSLTGEIVFTVADANAELLTKSSPAEEKPTISYGMIRPSDGEGHHIANITMRSEPLELPAWGNDTQTKADVTGLSSFYVTCVTGSAGSESQSWGNVGFSGSSTFSGGKYWPSSNLGYKFYASNASLSFASGGTTVAASNSTDVVVAYKTDATYYASSNSLLFSHIFGKVGSVTVYPADGFDSSDITDVSITIVPKTGGTYNIRTGSWSSVSTGSATAIANSTPGTKNNGLYLVPDTYTITASWTAKGKDFEGSGDFSVSAGECKNFAITLGGQVDICLPGAFSVSSSKKYYFATGNLQAVIEGTHPSDASCYTASEWKFAKTQYEVIGNAPGNTTFAVGSTVDLFGWVGAGSYSIDCYGLSTSTSTSNRGPYGYGGTSLKTDWGSIAGVVSEFNEGWKTMTRTEMNYLISSRSNATQKWTYASIGAIKGVVFLPDSWTLPANCTFTAYKLEYDTNVYTLGATGTTNAWCDMESAGAVFLPNAGARTSGTTVAVHETTFYYWLNDAYISSEAYTLSIVPSSYSASDRTPKTTRSRNRYVGLPVRLVRKDYLEPPRNLPSFGGLNLTSGPTYYDGSKMQVAKNWSAYGTYKKISGLYDGSIYFTFTQVGQYFDSRGNSFTTTSGDINNDGSKKVTYAGYTDWRMPTQAEWNTIVNGPRAGSTVNGNSSARYAIIQLTGVSYDDSSTPVGVLLFPDGKTITGKTLSGLNNTTCTTGVTTSELATYLSQGCVFLPAGGCQAGTKWVFGGSAGFYWSATSHDQNNAKSLDFSDDSIDTNSPYGKNERYLCIRLVRDAN